MKFILYCGSCKTYSHWISSHEKLPNSRILFLSKQKSLLSVPYYFAEKSFFRKLFLSISIGGHIESVFYSRCFSLDATFPRSFFFVDHFYYSPSTRLTANKCPTSCNPWPYSRMKMEISFSPKFGGVYSRRV